MTSPAGLLSIAALVLCPLGAAQERYSTPPPYAPTLVRVLVNWATAFDAGELDLGGQPNRSTEDVYEGIYVKNLGVPGKGRETTHMAVLEKLLFEAEGVPEPDVAWAVLHLAAAGFDRSLFDPDVLQVRDLGHWSLMRMGGEEVWVFLLDVASGKPARWTQESELREVPPAQQAAAIRLLGAENRPVFRVPVESRLHDMDPRIRLAASEALGQMQRSESIPVIARALVSERHPMVSQALVHTLQRVLESGVMVETQNRNVELALRVLGRSGWRTDMALVELAATFPSRGVIPPLLDALEGFEEDSLVRAVNDNASPRLRLRAWEVLCQLTGARLPEDQPEAWREFWEREQNNIEIIVRKKPVTMTRATFYGIPVTGKEIAFVIDTSGSMSTLVAMPADVASHQIRTRARRRRPDVNDGRWSRLDAAKNQLVTAVQSMDTDSRYHMLTFSDDVYTWSRKPVRPSGSSSRSLAGVLGKITPNGGTNVYDALFYGLGADQAVFGQQSNYTVDEVFLLSDGQPTAGRIKETDRLLRLVQELNRYQKIRINAVYTGTGSGARFLRRLAEENDGVFVQR